MKIVFIHLCQIAKVGLSLIVEIAIPYDSYGVSHTIGLLDVNAEKILLMLECLVVLLEEALLQVTTRQFNRIMEIIFLHSHLSYGPYSSRY